MQKKKTEIVTARMTPEVKHQLQARARDANMTLTSYLIICGLGQEIVRVEGLDTVLSELKAQGRNLNQLTTLANMGRITVLRGDDLIQEYVRLCDTLGTWRVSGRPARRQLEAGSHPGRQRGTGVRHQPGELH